MVRPRRRQKGECLFIASFRRLKSMHMGILDTLFRYPSTTQMGYPLPVNARCFLRTHIKRAAVFCSSSSSLLPSILLSVTPILSLSFCRFMISSPAVLALFRLLRHDIFELAPQRLDGSEFIADLHSVPLSKPPHIASDSPQMYSPSRRPRDTAGLREEGIPRSHPPGFGSTC